LYGTRDEGRERLLLLYGGGEPIVADWVSGRLRSRRSSSKKRKSFIEANTIRGKAEKGTGFRIGKGGLGKGVMVGNASD